MADPTRNRPGRRAAIADLQFGERQSVFGRPPKQDGGWIIGEVWKDERSRYHHIQTGYPAGESARTWGPTTPMVRTRPVALRGKVRRRR
jgi:hypothetical protein